MLILVHHTRKMDSEDPFDSISGSIGIPGVADTGFVLKRERGQSDAILYAAGRDVEEEMLALALSFDAATCTWSATGSAAERQVSKERQAVLDLLEQTGTMTPAEMAKELGKSREAIRKMLQRLKKEDLLESDQQGRYTLRNQKDRA